jgi:TRAP-type C4-dicarboxylate transport system permease small subunit
MKELGSFLIRSLNSLRDWALFILMLGVTLLVFVQVILRYVLRHPLMGIEELLLFPTIWLYFLGGANASRERSHIECRVVTTYLKTPTSIYVAGILKAGIALAVCAWLNYWAYEYFLYALRIKKESATLYIPMVFGESALFFGLLLMSYYTCLELIDYIRKFYAHLAKSEVRR